MAEIYKHVFQTISVYGHAVNLLDALDPGPGVHVDIGCGYGAIAEPLRDMHGRDYIGFDLAEDGLASLNDRGFEVCRIDLSDVEGSRKTIREALRGRRLSSLSMLDTLEHLANGPDVIAMLHSEAEATGASLVLSVPNVAHKDLALKLLVGRWDLTEAGLLDHTHLAFYTDTSLSRLMRALGWHEVGARDWLLEHSDQEFPRDLQVLRPSSPIGHFLRNLAEASNPNLLVNQFVRAYRPVQPQPIPLLNDRSEKKRPLLSIILSSVNAASTSLESVWKALASQTETDFEVLLSHPANWDNISEVLRPQVRFVPPENEGTPNSIDAAMAVASGEFITVVDECDLLSVKYVAAFAKLARDNPGAVLEVGRTPVWEPESTVSADSKSGLDFLDRISARPNGIAELAIPSSVVRDLGKRLVPSLGRWAVQDLAVHAILLCGIARDPSLTVSGGSNPAMNDSPDALQRWLERLSATPILLPVGSAAQLYYMAKAKNNNMLACEELTKNLTVMEANRKILNNRIAVLEMETERLRRVADMPQFKAFLDNSGVEICQRSASKHIEGETSRPFITIITRTQGTRPRTLRDTLLSLAGQSVVDFEWLLVVHSEDPAILGLTKAIIDEFPPLLTSRVRILSCTRPGRSAPLNDGFLQARGDYFCVLDDDDFVFSNYVEIFRNLARSFPERVLRMACLRQNFVMEETSVDEFSPRATSWFINEWPDEYDPLAHIHSNYTPFMSVAFPRQILLGLGLSFDESLSTTEDWDFTTRAVMLLGIASAADAGCVYRWWLKSESSAFLHAPEEWADNRHKIIFRLDSAPIILPAGSASRLCTLIDDKARLLNECSKLAQQTESLQAAQLVAEAQRLTAIQRSEDLQTALLLAEAQRLTVIQRAESLESTLNLAKARYVTLGSQMEASEAERSELRALLAEIEAAAEMRLRELLASSTWRVTKPFRRAWLAGLGRSMTPTIEGRPVSVRELLDNVRQIESSTIWEAAGLLRSARRIASRLSIRRFYSVFLQNNSDPRRHE